MSNLTVLSPAYNYEQASLMIQTANRVGLEPRLYDIGVLTDGHAGNIQYYDLLPILKNEVKTNYVLLTDAADVAFLAGEEEIIDQFRWFPQSFVVSAEREGCAGLNRTRERLHQMCIAANGYLPQINVGLWIATTQYAIEVLEKVRELWFSRPEDPDYSYNSHWQWLSMSKAWGLSGVDPEFDIDWHCRLFQSMSNTNGDVEYVIPDRRVHNKVTDTWPIAVHFNGDKTLGAYRSFVGRLLG